MPAQPAEPAEPDRSDAADDLTAGPWAYPGTAAECSGVLEGGRFTQRPVSDLLTAAASEARTAVVAVGSNASPAVMHRKLSRNGVGGAVPLVAGTLTGCAVGHSAHVSVPGFVPAAPYLRGDARTPVHVTLLDEAQLRCVDRTEPSYVRRSLSPGRCLLELEDGSRAESFDLYDSRWGVLAQPVAQPGGSVVPFGSQQALHTLLRTTWAPYAELLGDPGEDTGLVAVQAVMRALAADQGLRDRVREAFAATGWARPSGLAAD
jgi:hypothetical protein